MESAVLGRREIGKLDKRRRINEAARAVFTEFGYERANMREIAKRAGVATGTLFLYAPDKRNLLLWILNDDLDQVTEASFDALVSSHANENFLEQLLFVFEPRYRYFGADPDLSLHALQEHVVYHHRRQLDLQERITHIVRTQQRRGELRANEDPQTIARLVLAIFNAELRAWLRAGEPDLERGLGELRALLRMAIDGCAAATARGAGETSG